ncbi:MAG: hypothetical protein GF350_09110 [Chitinivibrionales bacterium]|nr:hypothetical protein [Chitinivibrionales bacterium]
MIRSELISRSPVKILEATVHGGLTTGNIGAITGPKGIGKTACLVHIATYQLLQNKHVIHVSFSDSPHHIVTWYEDIYAEVARRANLENARAIHDDIVKNRIIMNFTQTGLHFQEIEKRLASIIKNVNFHVDTVVVDGFDLSKAGADEFAEVHHFAAELQLKVWFSFSKVFKPDTTALEALAGFTDEFELIIRLKQQNDSVHLLLEKDHDTVDIHDMHLVLDPATLLISEEAS